MFNFKHLTVIAFFDDFPRDQHVYGVVQVAVIDLRSYPKKMTHQWVNVDSLKGIHYQVLLEVRTHCPEEVLHVHVFIVKAMISFVALQWEEL